MVFVSCTNSQQEVKKIVGEGIFLLDANRFSDEMSQHESPIVIDVRTPEEFEKGHIENAINIDWNGSDFESKINEIDKNKTAFVYCLGGGRSAEATAKMKDLGFKQIIELEGGMMKWRAASLPEAGQTKATISGLTKSQFNDLIASDQIVLVDFFAPWCGPCKKMAPYLKEIEKEFAGKLKLLKIDVDENETLAAELQIESIPVLQLYQNGKLVWSNIGFTPKEKVLEEINKLK